MGGYNLGCQAVLQQYYGSKTASDRILRGRSPWGLGGAVYLLIYLLVRVHLFINMRLLMLSIRG